MKKVILQFQTVHELFEFVDVTKRANCEINQHDARLDGHLSEAEIELAVNGYRAKLVQ